MPTYQYQCKSCGHELEEFQQMSEEALVRCPACGQDSLSRVLGSGGGLIFKGSGFHLTDYRKEQPKTGSTPKEEKKPDTTKPAPDPGTKKE